VVYGCKYIQCTAVNPTWFTALRQSQGPLL